MWLRRWLPLVIERAAGAPLLELGCGTGEDSAVLTACGLELIGIDLSEQAIASAQARIPRGRFLVQDVRVPFPLGIGEAGVIVASLSLHYFPLDETESLISRILETLRPNGVLLCRLNSSNDHNYGASGHPQIDEGYYLVNREPKRFFDCAAIRRLFRNGWQILSLEEVVTYKYAVPKVVWEVVLSRDRPVALTTTGIATLPMGTMT